MSIATHSATDCVVEYLKLLHDHGVGSEEAESFKKQHADEPTFIRRAKAAELLYQHRDQILEELDKVDQETASGRHRPQ